MNLHCIGIGGIGLSAIAQIFRAKGHSISGSDNCQSEITDELISQGIPVTIGEDPTIITSSLDQVLYSLAIPENHPELVAARRKKIPTTSYPEALGELTKTHTTIAVAGTHGKSTTTAMIALIAAHNDKDPTVVIGTKIHEFGEQNFRIGQSNLMIVEACEYKKAFLQLHPDILIITNMEMEHPDVYQDFNEYTSAFKQLVKKLPTQGTLIVPEELRHSPVTEGYTGKILTPEHDAKELTLTPQVPGKFNIQNASYAALAAQVLGIENKKIEHPVGEFRGTWRRMEQKHTTLPHARFIDDYAHHPTEIRATLKALREKFPEEKILCVFQPHQYSRTHALFDEFAHSFKSADKVIIPNIYRVRDSHADVAKVSAQELVKAITHAGTPAEHGQNLKNTAQLLQKYAPHFDLIVTMGAGDIYTLYELL